MAKQTYKQIMDRLAEVESIYARNPKWGKIEMETLLKRAGKRSDNAGMSVRVAAYRMGLID